VKPLAIFDLDGTLIDSGADIARALNAALAEHGRPTLTTSTVVAMIGDGFVKLCERALGPEQLSLVGPVTESFGRHYRAAPVVESRVYPGLTELLSRLQQDVRCVVATNKAGGLAREILELVGLERWFERVVGEDDTVVQELRGGSPVSVAVRKPDRRVVDGLLAATATPRHRAVMVGDSLVDVEVARNAGIPVCAVSWGYGAVAGLRAAGPDYLVGSAAELEAALRSACPAAA
jgi:phosphoglycolate phosphatase